MVNWNEQIRPSTYAEIVGNKDFVKDFKHWATTGEYPTALLLMGPPGTGKTSAAIAISKTMLGDYHNEMNVLYTNASDDRGIGYIREFIKSFARISGIGVNRKIVQLDEADGLTPVAQDALRAIIEQYASKVLFILTANYPDKIKSAIKSRCRTYVFKRVSPDEGKRHLLRLTESCGAPSEWEAHYDTVVEQHNGDLRASVNWLESLPQTSDALQMGLNEPITEDIFNTILNDDWLSLREQMLDSLYRTGERTSMMRNLHRYVSKHFEKNSDVTFEIMCVWGDMMEHIYEWPGSDESFIDVFVGRLKKIMEIER